MWDKLVFNWGDVVVVSVNIVVELKWWIILLIKV